MSNLLQSKLTIPHPGPGTIERPRLLRQVLESPEADLILLVAPAGYGKTTLAGQLIDRRNAASRAWLHLDRRDTTTARFLRYFCAALSTVVPALKGIGPLSDEEVSAGAIQTVIEDIGLAFEQHRGSQGWVVLDNWECVDGNEEIAVIPPAVAAACGGRLRLIITSRVTPSFKIRRQQARGRIIRIDAADLAFNLPECQEAMNRRLGGNLPETEIEQFWKRTSGWCVSVGLLSKAASSIGRIPKAADDASPDPGDAMEGYVREELYDNLPGDLAEFLSRTSLFEVLTPARCEAVIPDPKLAVPYLDRLAGSALPLEVLDEHRHFRLHGLVRQAFRSALIRTISPEIRADLFRQAAGRYLEESMPYEAIELLMEVGDHATALELMSSRWSELNGQHGWRRVRQWLEQLPEEYHERPAYIKTFSNVLNVAGDSRGGIRFLADKLQPERFGDDVEDYGSLWANYWWARVSTETKPLYAAVASAHRDLLNTITGFSPTMLGIFQNTLAVAAYQELRLREAVQHVMTAADLVEEPYARLRVIARQNEALYKHLLGRSVEALDILDDLVAECLRLDFTTQLTRIHMVQANIHLAMGYYRRALADLDRAVARAREFGSYSLQYDAYLGRFRGLALWHLGDRDEGIKLIRASHKPAREYGHFTGTEVGLLGEYHSLLDGRPIELVDRTEIPGRDQVSESRLMYLALEAAKAGKPRNQTAVRKCAVEITRHATERGLRPWSATGAFLMSLAGGRDATTESEKERLREALSTLREIEWRTYPMANDALTAFVVARAVRLGIGWDLIDQLRSDEVLIDLTSAFDAELKSAKLTAEERTRLLEGAVRLSVRGLSAHLDRAAKVMTDEAGAAVRNYRSFLLDVPLPALRISVLGGFSVSCQGRSVQFGRSSSRLLLQHLLVAYPRSVHGEVLMEELWPDGDPDKSRANLRTAAKDLRRALDPYGEPRGRSHVTYVDQHYGLDLPVGSYVDLLEFTSRVEECSRLEASMTAAPDDRIGAYRDALAIYYGQLLPMLPYDAFTIEPRERLQALYQRSSLQLARLLLKQGALDESAAVMEKALSFDPVWTDGVRMLLQVYVAQARTLNAMRMYRDYERRLRDELALEPDESLRDYFDELMKPHSA